MKTELTITQEELDSLLSSLEATIEKEKSAGRGRQNARKVHEARVHDFIRSEKLSHNAVQAIEQVHAAFARGVSSVLSNYLHTRIQVSLLSLEQVTFAQFLRSVPDPTVLSLFSIEPLPGRAILEINPSIVFWILDYVLGGQGDAIRSPRPLTDMEKSLIEGTLAKMLNELGIAWKNMMPIEPKLTEIAQNAGSAAIADLTDAVLVTYFEVTIGSVVGMASICIPILPIGISQIDASPGKPPKTIDGNNTVEPAALRDRIAAGLENVSVPCVIRLGSIEIPSNMLETLSEGDVLCLDRSVGEALELLVLKSPKYYCKPIAIGNKLAVEILDVIS
jgi:flagellar motor switch protein FliM